MQTVLDTEYGWMIRCDACKQHYIPKGRWTFNGDMVRPTFTPSVNESVNQPTMEDYRPDCPSSRCHFTVTDADVKMYAMARGS